MLKMTLKKDQQKPLKTPGSFIHFSSTYSISNSNLSNLAEFPNFKSPLHFMQTLVMVCVSSVDTRLLRQMDKKLSLCILIGHLQQFFGGPPLGQNSSHLITHYDNIITDVPSNKVNSWRTVCNVSNWSFLFMPVSIYQHAPGLQIAPAVGTAAHMARRFTGR